MMQHSLSLHCGGWLGSLAIVISLSALTCHHADAAVSFQNDGLEYRTDGSGELSPPDSKLEFENDGDLRIHVSTSSSVGERKAADASADDTRNDCCLHDSLDLLIWVRSHTSQSANTTMTGDLSVLGTCSVGFLC